VAHRSYPTTCSSRSWWVRYDRENGEDLAVIQNGFRHFQNLSLIGGSSRRRRFRYRYLDILLRREWGSTARTGWSSPAREAGGRTQA